MREREGGGRHRERQRQRETETERDRDRETEAMTRISAYFVDCSRPAVTDGVLRRSAGYCGCRN